MSSTPWINSPSATRSESREEKMERTSSVWVIIAQLSVQKTTLALYEWSALMCLSLYSLASNRCFDLVVVIKRRQSCVIHAILVFIYFHLHLTIFPFVKELPEFICSLVSCVFIIRKLGHFILRNQLKNCLLRGKTTNKQTFRD